MLQGDIEHIAIRLKPDLSGIVDDSEAIGFEHHGDLVWFNKTQGIFENETHVVAYAARNGHASYNALTIPGSAPDDNTQTQGK